MKQLKIEDKIHKIKVFRQWTAGRAAQVNLRTLRGPEGEPSPPLQGPQCLPSAHRNGSVPSHQPGFKMLPKHGTAGRAHSTSAPGGTGTGSRKRGLCSHLTNTPKGHTDSKSVSGPSEHSSRKSIEKTQNIQHPIKSQMLGIPSKFTR